jgi:hypothetical protein
MSVSYNVKVICCFSVWKYAFKELYYKLPTGAEWYYKFSNYALPADQTEALQFRRRRVSGSAETFLWKWLFMILFKSYKNKIILELLKHL